MPTVVGDIVAAYRGRSAFGVWIVSENGRQQPGPETRISAALGRDAALKPGRLMARDSRGALFVVAQDGVTWTNVRDRP